MTATPNEQRPADATAPKAKRQAPADPKPEGIKGPHSTVQHDDDGWNDLPVQMRG